MTQSPSGSSFRQQNNTKYQQRNRNNWRSNNYYSRGYEKGKPNRFFYCPDDDNKQQQAESEKPKDTNSTQQVSTPQQPPQENPTPVPQENLNPQTTETNPPAPQSQQKSAQPNSNQPNSTQSNTNQPNSAQPNTNRSNSKQTNQQKPTHPNTNQPQTGQSNDGSQTPEHQFKPITQESSHPAPIKDQPNSTAESNHPKNHNQQSNQRQQNNRYNNNRFYYRPPPAENNQTTTEPNKPSNKPPKPTTNEQNNQPPPQPENKLDNTKPQKQDTEIEPPKQPINASKPETSEKLPQTAPKPMVSRTFQPVPITPDLIYSNPKSITTQQKPANQPPMNIKEETTPPPPPPPKKINAFDICGSILRNNQQHNNGNRSYRQNGQNTYFNNNNNRNHQKYRNNRPMNNQNRQNSSKSQFDYLPPSSHSQRDNLRQPIVFEANSVPHELKRILCFISDKVTSTSTETEILNTPDIGIEMLGRPLFQPPLSETTNLMNAPTNIVDFLVEGLAVNQPENTRFMANKQYQKETVITLQLPIPIPVSFLTAGEQKTRLGFYTTVSSTADEAQKRIMDILNNVASRNKTVYTIKNVTANSFSNIELEKMTRDCNVALLKDDIVYSDDQNAVSLTIHIINYDYDQKKQDMVAKYMGEMFEKGKIVSNGQTISSMIPITTCVYVFEK